jgi:diacylglycerol kinase family enzyme
VDAGVVVRVPPAAPADLLLERLAESAEPGAGVERKRMMIIVNPYATTVSDRLRNLVVYALQGRYEVTAIDTEARGHAVELCREAAHEGFDVVVAFGGDGTVNEVARGLAGSDTPLTCLPGGSANVYCKQLGIPGEIVDATEHLLRMADEWRVRKVDVGMVNERLFAFSAGLGLDADVVRRVDARPRLKARYGPWWFTYAAVTTFTAHYLVKPPRLELIAGDQTLRGVTALVQNGHPFTYFKDRPIDIAEGAELDDGTLSAAVLERASPIDMPTVIWRVFSRRSRVLGHHRISGLSDLEHLEVRSADGRPIALQVDGDHVDDVTEARFGLRRRHLTVVS